MHLTFTLFGAWASVAFAASPLVRPTVASRNSTKSYAFGLPSVNATYDYVIVGGGTAGLTLAKRLTENSTLNVAVIEAGGFYEADDGNISTTPAYDIFYSGTDPKDTNPKVDWGFITEPQAVRSII